MTLMVRDEADVIRASIEHHLQSGIETIIVTDNGSVDGTTEILEEFAAQGAVDLRHDPVHLKQQAQTVTGMARDAATMYGADWVINADADEFWVPVNRSLSLRDAFEGIPTSLGSFTVPVVDMTGAPAMRGTGLSRLRFRDLRPVEALRRVGLHAHSTSDAVHIGDPDITVVQGNHMVSIASKGRPDSKHAIEVLHLPWRSWEQFSRKAANAGKAYEDNPNLEPSPNHHGMRDYRRLQAGTLFAWYIARHPEPEELAHGLDVGHFVEDLTLAGRSAGVVPDEPVDSARAHEVGQLARATAIRDIELGERTAELSRLLADNERLEHALATTESELSAIRQRRVVRLADRAARMTSTGLRRSPS
jgi:hypothetical protein